MMTHRTKFAAAAALLSTADLAPQRVVAADEDEYHKTRRVDKTLWDAAWAGSLLQSVTKPFSSFGCCDRACRAGTVVEEKWQGLELVDRAEKDVDDWRTTHKYEGQRSFTGSYTSSYGRYQHTHFYSFSLPSFSITGQGRVDKTGHAFKSREFEVAVPTKVTKAMGEDFLMSYDKLDKDGLETLKSDFAAAKEAAVTATATNAGITATLCGLGWGCVLALVGECPCYNPWKWNGDNSCTDCMGTTGPMITAVLSLPASIASLVLCIVSWNGCCDIAAKQEVLDHENCHAHVKTGKTLQSAEEQVRAMAETAFAARQAKVVVTNTPSSVAASSEDVVVNTEKFEQACAMLGDLAELGAMLPAHEAEGARKALDALRKSVEEKLTGDEKQKAVERLDALKARFAKAETAAAAAKTVGLFAQMMTAVAAFEILADHAEEATAQEKEVAVAALRVLRTTVAEVPLSEDAEQRALGKAEKEKHLRRIDRVIAKLSPVSVWVILLSVLGGLVFIAILLALVAAARSAQRREALIKWSGVDREDYYGGVAYSCGEVVQQEEDVEGEEEAAEGEEAAALVPGAGERV